MQKCIGVHYYGYNGVYICLIVCILLYRFDCIFPRAYFSWYIVLCIFVSADVFVLNEYVCVYACFYVCLSRFYIYYLFLCVYLLYVGFCVCLCEYILVFVCPFFSICVFVSFYVVCICVWTFPARFPAGL